MFNGLEKKFGTIQARNGMCLVTFGCVGASSLEVCLRCLELPGGACEEERVDVRLYWVVINKKMQILKIVSA